MSNQSNPIEFIIHRETLKVLKGATALYLVSVPLTVVATGFLIVAFGGLITVFTYLAYAYFVVVALYAVFAYLWISRNPRSIVSNHLYGIGLLGFVSGGTLFIVGAFGFLNSGYWRSQMGKNKEVKCPWDGGEIVQFGPGSLVCLKCSRVPRIGFDSPKKWRKYAVGALALGAVLYALSLAFSSVGFSYLGSVGLLLILEACLFFFLNIFEGVMVPSKARLPNDTSTQEMKN